MSTENTWTRRQTLGAIAAGLVSGPAFGQETWPSRPIRMIVPSAGGSGSDIMARTFADVLSKALSQPVVIDNRPGANGVLAVDILVRQPADGYTLGFLSSSSTVINQALQPNRPHDFSGLVPIVQIGAGGIHLVVAPDFPAKTVREFVDVVKANPGKYNYASWGIGSTGQLMMEWLKSQAGLDIRHVPYKTIPQIYQDIQGGNIAIGWVDASSSVPLIKTGRLRALALSGSRRGPAIPDLPTLTQQGFRFETDTWYGIFAPKGTSAHVVDNVNRLIRQSFSAEEMKARFLNLNLGDTPQRSPAEFAKVVEEDLLVWQDIVRRNNIKID